MKKILNIFILSFGLICVLASTVQAQDGKKSTKRSERKAAKEAELVEAKSDSTAIAQDVKVHSPHLATVYSAILPGLGQIYNRKWWKVPILYGGFFTLGYFINDNNNYYLRYKQAYADITDDNPLTNSFQDLGVEGNWDWSDPSDVSQFATSLENAKDAARRNRDLLIICTVGVYAIQILDAAVDAHFFNYDISDDISFNWSPGPVNCSGNIYPGVALQLNF